MVLSAELQEKIKKNPTNTIVGNDSKDIKEHYNIYKKIINSPVDIPETFDGIKIWSKFLSKPINQGSCGSCWAFSSVSMLADRFNIQSLGKININLSPTRLIICDYNDNEKYKLNKKGACLGNTLVSAIKYLFIVGTNTLDCIPYDNLGSFVQYQSIAKFDEFAKLPFCHEISGENLDLCNGYSIDSYTNEEIGIPALFYKSNLNYSILGTKTKKFDASVKQIEIEIYKWGPVCTAMLVYPSFYTFDPKKEIYEPEDQEDQEDIIGGHAIEIVGWGKENGKNFWQVKNSWGTEWGINGYFKILKGENTCLIEENCVAMQPNFFYPQNYKNIQKVDIGINPGKINEVINMFSKRDMLANNITSIAGGINSRTGYSRRVMNKYPWINYDPPIYLDYLPNWENFIAGLVTVSKNIYKNQEYNLQTNTSQQNIICLYYILFLSMTIVVFFILTLKLFNSNFTT
ncbi:MAG: hypothetical protein CBD97_02120 [Pelagibacteraceae bacterium TMED237]|nr:MAG: hypothetical protein CBD97_02120 [Pelagibacteraceae bacterium TMED237]|tara:strand:- start:943 stop:2319 length:1377 start_codon:yes stop_codon:yes gene_type:complete